MIALSKYLSADDGPGIDEIQEIARKIPQDVVITLFAKSIHEKRTLKRRLRRLSPHET